MPPNWTAVNALAKMTVSVINYYKGYKKLKGSNPLTVCYCSAINERVCAATVPTLISIRHNHSTSPKRIHNVKS